MAKGKNTAGRVEELALPVARDCGVSLWDVRYEKEGPDWYLRIFIDKQGGVTIDDCERVSRAIDPVLDAEDPIAESYCLEVSSPGLGRRLTRPEHFAAMAGQEVALRLIRPVDGARDFEGTLAGKGEDGAVTLNTPDGPRTFAGADIGFVKLCDDKDLF